LDIEIEKNCVQYPRFYLLDKEKIIETLSYSNDCRNYLSTVKLLFPCIRDFIYSLSPMKSNNLEKNKLNTTRAFTHIDESTTLLLTQLDLDINGLIKIMNLLLLIHLT
jgi:hypothetical protein